MGQKAWNVGRNAAHQDLSGRRYGKWQVLREDGKHRYGPGTIEYLWACVCDCGTERTVRGSSLRSGGSGSCGCVRREQLMAKTLPDSLSLKRRLFRECRRRADDYERSFTLEFDLFCKLLIGQCYFCGRAPSHQSRSDYSSPDFKYHGVDRLDNERGYEPDNSVSCCGRCNGMKSDMSESEFLAHAAMIIAHRGSA